MSHTVVTEAKGDREFIFLINVQGTIMFVIISNNFTYDSKYGTWKFYSGKCFGTDGTEYAPIFAVGESWHDEHCEQVGEVPSIKDEE